MANDRSERERENVEERIANDRSETERENVELGKNKERKNND